jgi:hypothetical protein
MDNFQIDIPTPTPYPTPDFFIELEYDDTALMMDGAQYYVGLYQGMNKHGHMEVLQGGIIIILLLLSLGLVLEQLKKD